MEIHAERITYVLVYLHDLTKVIMFQHQEALHQVAVHMLHVRTKGILPQLIGSCNSLGSPQYVVSGNTYCGVPAPPCAR